MQSFQKPIKIKSKKIRDSAKGETCSLRLPGICNHNPETVVFAHVHTRFSGMAIKSNDIHGFYSCSHCHTAYDQKKVDNIDVLGAMCETQVKLYMKNLIGVK